MSGSRLKQHGMPFKFFCPVEEITVRGQYPAAVGTQGLGHIDHFGIELADPLHFIFLIQKFINGRIAIIEAYILYNIAAFHYNIAIYSLTLEFRYNSEYQPDKFVGLYGGFDPEKF